MLDVSILPSLLKQLRLDAIRDCCDQTAQLAESQGWTYQQYLAVLCDKQLSCREQRRIQRHLHEAKLPVGKTLDTFEFAQLNSIKRTQLNSFAETTSWIDHAQNLILFGPSGVGKTHLAAAIGKRLVEHGIRVLFVKTTLLVQELQVAFKEKRLSGMLDKLARYELLILDDIGYVQKSKKETSVLFELIADRYETKSLLITANQPFDQWESLFPNDITAVAAIDRLVHHATIINIDEQSYRTKTQKSS
jgi:DNA replication protein DnaC